MGIKKKKVTKKKVPSGGKLRVLYSDTLDDKTEMLTVLLQEGTNVLDTNDRLRLKLLTEPFIVKVPKEIVYAPLNDWDKYESEDDD